jgi:ATP-binding cassette subfamily F protein uup
LDNVVTSTIAFEGDAKWREYEGGVSDWLIQTKRANEINAAQGKTTAKPFNYEREQLQKQEQASAQVSASTPTASAVTAPVKAKKLSFKEQRELDSLPATIATLEAEQKEITEALADGSLYAIDNTRAMRMAQRNAQIDDELMVALERWDALGKPT